MKKNNDLTHTKEDKHFNLFINISVIIQTSLVIKVTIFFEKTKEASQTKVNERKRY